MNFLLRPISLFAVLCLTAVALTAIALKAAAPPPPVKEKVGKLDPDHARKMAAGRELFTQKVRPLLVAHCLKCHGGEKTRGGLDLSSREGLLKGSDNGTVVVLGKSKQSKLFRLPAHLDKPTMPPRTDPVNKTALEALARWIDLGAPYDRPLVNRPRPKTELRVTAEDRQFWSFVPIARPGVPAVKDSAWTRNAIDTFILAALEKRGLLPNESATRRTLIRRLRFDLTGLPPTPEEVEEFVNDTRPGAYERLVDRLLASPHHGEHWARHWLDLVRFGESHGFEHDYDRPTAYPYRDFVIRALNADLPYSTFIRWQIAGDELAPGDPLAWMATGFLAAGVHSTQITANTAEKERYDELDDIVRTIGTSMLGLTIGCARCHDHKYDPIPTRDYYRLLSTFTTTVRSEIDVELDPAAIRQARLRHTEEIARLEEELRRHERATLPAKLERWLADHRGRSAEFWVLPDSATVRSVGKTTFAPQPDGSFLVSGENPGHDIYAFTLRTGLEKVTALRLDALAHPSLVKGGPGRAKNGNFALSDVRLAVAPAEGKVKPREVKLLRPRATFEQRGLPVAATIDADPRSAWAVDPQFGKDHAVAYDLAEPIYFPGGSVLKLTLSFRNNAGHNIGRPRISLGRSKDLTLKGAPIPAAVLAALSRPDAAKDPRVLEWFRTTDPGWRKLHDRVEAVRRAGPKVPAQKTLVCSEGLKPLRLHTQGADFFPETWFLKRGDVNQKIEVAKQGFLQVLTRTAESPNRWLRNAPTGARTPFLRRNLADWLTDVEHGAGSLLARVIVNRAWHYHFGHGIVRTPGDFGMQGERPSHPELLDFLASELIESGWSLKHLHRLILTSSTYRQSTRSDEARLKADPDNRLLWRQVPRRLQAEAIRDALLAVSGDLDRRQFGPGTLDPKQKRRSIYFFVKRSQLPQMMILFDGPDGVTGVEQRATTTIAPQALLMMNNEIVRDWSAGLARRAASGASDPTGRIRAGYAIALGRAPSSRELARSLAFLRGQTDLYREESQPDPELRALTDLCHVLVQLNEFVYVD